MQLMLQPVEKRLRRAVMRASLAVTVCGLLSAPLAGFTSGYVPGHKHSVASKPSNVRREDPWDYRAVNIVRDPFLNEAAFFGSMTSGPTSARSGLIGMKVVQGQPISPAGLTPAVVRAIALGREPKAVIDMDGSTRIVAPGDLINGIRVESILSDRVVLRGGTSLRFSSKSP
jgi:hypothetical protein